MSGFELISLAATVTEPMAVPESSDDGLDPNEFLSQSVEEHESRNQTLSPIERIDLTPTILNSELFANPSRLSDSDPAASVMESFHFTSTDSYRSTFGGDSPLEHLQTQNEALNRNMSEQIKLLDSTLLAGDDCTSVRASLVGGFAQLSENCYLLHEMYTQELALVELLLSNFEAWDRRRSRVLRLVQSIKSEDNKYGTKLAGLLNRRSEVDDEIEQLERRIAVLRENRAAVDSEIDKTSSVLESKSAKYVNVFRELERQGREAISGYLAANGLPEQHWPILLRSEPVEATFAYSSISRTRKSEFEGTERQINGSFPGKAQERALEKSQEKAHERLSASTMGMQPLELPVQEEESQIYGTRSGETVSQVDDSAYAKGYAKGTEQLERLRKGINSFVTHVFPAEPKPRLASTVDDALNTITEKIDLEPILALLTSKLDALSSLKVKNSRMSADYHDYSVVLKDAYRSVEANERSLVALLSEQPKTSDLMQILSRSFTDLKELFESHSDNPRAHYLAVILHHELTAVACAMSGLSHDGSFESRVPELNKAVLEASMRVKQDPRLSYRITGNGFRPVSVPNFNARKPRHKSPPATKGVKGE